MSTEGSGEIGRYGKAKAADIAAIRESDLFDGSWYVSQYEDVKMLEMDPAEHYLVLGWQLNRNPSPKFDTAAYLSANADVKKAGINPLLHYIQFGRTEKRQLNKNVPSAIIPARPASLAEQMPKAGIAQFGSQVVERTKELGSKAIDKLTGAAREYSIIETGFDKQFYLRRYLDIALAKIDPVKHYIEHGAREGRDPSTEFVTKYYVNRYPDVAKSGQNPFYHWLTIGRQEGRGATPFSAGEPNFDTMCEMLGRQPKEVERDLIERRRDLRNRFENGILGEMVKKAGELEPLIHHAWLAALQTRIPPFHGEPLMAQVAGMYRLQKEAEWRKAKAVIAIQAGGLSGVTRIAGHLATALSEIYGADEVIVVRTQASTPVYPAWFPSKVRQVDLSAVLGGIGPHDQQRLLVEFIRSVRPIAAFNMNSQLFWTAMRPYGKALSASVALYAYLFCNDMNIYGNWDGYPARQFYRYFDIYRATITDSEFLAEDLRTKFLVPPDQNGKIVVWDTPISTNAPLAKAPAYSPTRRPQVFWAGRFDRQKRVDVVVALAARMPEIDFRLWGEPILDKSFDRLKLPKNISLEGVYKDFADLPVQHCDLWLYTSEWDGVPNMLFEVASVGLPLVSSRAGGCDDVLVDGLCERVDSVEDITSFESAIRRILANPSVARERAAQLRELILERRKPQRYREDVARLLAEVENGRL